jgi:low affinity Fe/Cu permease
MSSGGRARARGRVLQRAGLIAGALVVLSLLFAVSGHWVLTIITAVAATVAVWVLLQARAVR